MTPEATTDLLQFYTTHFRPGAVDLSSSSPPPAPLPDLGREILRHNGLAYSLPGGSPGLRSAIAARYQHVSAEDVVISAGASEALVAVASAMLRPGDVAWVSRGAYPSFTNAAARSGATVTHGEFIPGGSACALANNPSVPDGLAIDLPFFLAAAHAAGATPVVDEVYRDLRAGGSLPAAVDLDARAVSIGDLSKPLGLGGLRIGWVATRDRELLARIDRELQLLTGGPSSLSVAAPEAAMASFHEHISAAVECVLANTPAIVAVLEGHGWQVTLPDAGVTLVARPPAPVTTVALARLEAAGFFLLPTDTLGLPGAFRITLLRDPSSLACALGSLEEGVQKGTASLSVHGGRAVSRINNSPLPVGLGVRKRTPETFDYSPGREGDAAQTECAVVVLTKAPVAGHAKTRLAATIGAGAAATIARACLADTISLAESGPWTAIVAHSSPAMCSCVGELVTTAALATQVPGGLGDRIHAALAGALGNNGRVVLIGSDTPDLPPSLVQEAFDVLSEVDLVLGPAADGGFYLIGVTAAHPSLLECVPWSTSTVLETVRENAGRLGLRVRYLHKWCDVDDIASLRALGHRLATHDRAPRTRAALANLTGVMDRV